MLIILILKPIFNVFSENGIENLFGYMDKEFNQVVAEKESKFYDEKTKTIIKTEFLEKLNEQAKNILNNVCEVYEVEFILDDSSFNIKQANFVIGEKTTEKSFFRIEKFKTSDEKEKEFILNVKKIISDFYNLSFDNINIIVRKS